MVKGGVEHNWIGGWEGRGARHGRGEGRGAVGMIGDGGVWRG